MSLLTIKIDQVDLNGNVMIALIIRQSINYKKTCLSIVVSSASTELEIKTV